MQDEVESIASPIIALLRRQRQARRARQIGTTAGLRLEARRAKMVS
jgi:hypothetical protein